MLVTWRYKPRKSLIQSFDPRAWIIFFLCYIACTVLFWDLRYLLVLFIMAMVVVFTSGIKFSEMRRAWLFIGGFVVFFSFLTFLTGRGGIELYTEEHLIARWEAGFTLLGWRPTLTVTAEKTMYAVSMLVRVFSLASMTILIPYSLNPAHYGIRTERWKRIFYYGLALDASGAVDEPSPAGWELYDMQNDPFELHNLYPDPAYADIVRQSVYPRYARKSNEPSARVIVRCAVTVNGNNTSTSASKKTKSTCPPAGTGIGRIVALNPPINSRLNRHDPMTFPSARSLCPR